MKPSEFTFSIEHDQWTGQFIHFDHPRAGDNEIWEELEEFIEDRGIGLYRLEECDYETDQNIDDIRDVLLGYGFVEEW